MDCQGSNTWSGYYKTWNPLLENSADARLEDSSESLEQNWSYMQYAGGEMSSIPMENASNGQYFCSLHKQSPTYNVYSASTSYSASPPSHHNVLATPPIAIPRIISQTGLSSTQMSPSTYHRSNSGISLDAASLSPLEPASPFSNSMTESMPMSRSSTNNMPSVQGHGLSSYDANTLRCYCGSEFKGAKAKNIRSNFKRHLKTKGTQIQCPLCDKVFNRQDNVQQHIRTRHVRR